MTDVLTLTELTATFKPGNSALGHHWNLFDADENPVGRTKREYGGGVAKRGMWRMVTATGMDSGQDIKAQVLDGDGKAIAHVFSRNEKQDPRVEVSDGDRRPIGSVHNVDGEELRYDDATGQVIARVPLVVGAEAWQLEAADGTPLGVLSRVKAVRAKGPSLLDYATGLNTVTDNAQDFQRTMHLGFAFSNTYGVALAELPPPGTLRTLAVLTPVIAAYAY